MHVTGLQPLLYEKCRPFDASDGDMRIFAPVAYKTVRHAAVVPIVHIETLSLASWFPVCWQMRDKEAVLVVLRTLRADGSGQPAGSPSSMASLPLALRAYPFVVGNSGDSTDGAHLLEATIPDEPSDVGAPILTSAGKVGPGARMKMQALAAFNHALPLSQAMTADLVEQDMLEPWPLRFEIGADVITVDDLFVVKQSAFSSAKTFLFIERFGPAAASFLGAHRVSLFRAGILVQTAKETAAAVSENR